MWVHWLKWEGKVSGGVGVHVMHVGCECNVVIATYPQSYLESTVLCCDLKTTLLQLSQRDIVKEAATSSWKR